MTASVYRLVTAGTTNLNKIRQDSPKVKGIIAVNTAAYAIFVKLYWFRPVNGTPAPTVGTTAPQVTIEIPALGTTTGGIERSFTEGFSGGDGDLWIAVTKLAADSDTTAVVAGDGLISLLVDP
jgi:hypothetical protein